MECFWIRNTEITLAKLRRATKGVAMLPLASIESHGPHLPLGSDCFGIDNLIERVIQREPVAVLPVLPYTNVVEARMLLGAIHIPTELLLGLLETICDEAYRNGFNKIVLLHGHGGNESHTLTFLVRMLEREKPYSLYVIPIGAGRTQEMGKLIETSPTGHACESETSIDMVACPDLVDLKALGKKTFPARPVPQTGAARTTAWWIAAYPEMAVGYPQKATRDKGEKLLQLWADGIVDSLCQIKKDRRCAAAVRSYVRRAHAVGLTEPKA